MALPDLIEIVPLDKPVRAEITVPGSKSITNRALILAALADGEVTLTGALWSEDTQVMTEALRTLGFDVGVENDPAEFCNRTITVRGLGGTIPKAGTAEQPLELFVGNAGTAARFLAAMVCLGNGVYRLHGVARMHERPQAALFKALRELGYRVDSTNDKLPAIIFGSSRRESAQTELGDMSQSGLTSAATSKGLRSCKVSIAESSQFASALLLCAKHGGWDVKVVGENAEESPYVAMTNSLTKVFPRHSGSFHVEPDSSSGSYFIGAYRMLNECERFEHVNKTIVNADVQSQASSYELSEIYVKSWADSFWQIDSRFREMIAPKFDNTLPVTFSRRDDLGDSIMTVIALAPLIITEPTRFTELSRLRVQECERVVALRTELTKCGAKAIEQGDILTIHPSDLHGAEIVTYNDHRMAMCFAILGLKVPGIKLKNPACVKKTFPNFFQKLATPPPNGLGVEIHDGRTGRKLEMDELFAD